MTTTTADLRGVRGTPGSRRTVLHVTQAASAGVAHVVADLARAQSAAGWEVVVACPTGPTDDLAGLARGAGARVLPWNAARGPSASVRHEARALARTIEEVDPDVVHLHSSQAGLVGRMVLRGRRPTVFSPHAWSWRAMDGTGARLAVGWERLAARWTDVLGCVSDDERREGVRHGLRGPYRVVANQAPPPTTVDRDAARAALGVTGELVVSVGRLAPQKAPEVLLEAWRTVAAERPDAHLVLVGDGPLRTQVADLARALPRVTLAGWLSRADTLRWMRAADVVAGAARYEGMSLVPLEAAALGVPVVTTRVEGSASTLSERARTLVPTDDAPALAEALVRVLADPRARADGGREALAWSQERAAAVSPGVAYLGVYEELLDPVVGISAPAPAPPARTAGHSPSRDVEGDGP